MNRERLDQWCEAAIFVLTCACLIFGPLATGAVRAVDFLVIQWLTLGITSCWLIRSWLGINPRWFWPPVCWAVLAFVGYAIVRYQQSDIEYVARQEMIKVLVYAVIFFAVLNNLNRQEYPRWIACALVFLGMAISMYAVYQFATKSDRVWHFFKPAYVGRGTGTYINPNHLAGFLETVLPLGVAFVMMGRVGHVVRILLGYASLIILAAIGVTFSRGGWIAAILSLLVFLAVLVLRKSFRLPAIVGIIILSAGILGFASENRFIQERFQGLFKLGGQSPVSRKILWQAAYEIWQDNFWWGAGPAHFDYRFGAYRPPYPEIQMRPDRVHNDYLNTLVDWGVVGTVLVASVWALLYLSVFTGWKYLNRDSAEFGSRTSNRAAFVLGAATGLFAILIHSFTDFNMHIPANAILAVTLMALISGHLRFVSERFWVSPGLVTRLFVTLLMATAAAYLGKEGFKRGLEERWLRQAARAEKYSTQQIELLKEAYAVEPMNFETAYKIGEAFRIQSWPGNLGYEILTKEAMQWFARAIRLNPYDSLSAFSHLRYGMCLHHLGRHSEADPYFQRAIRDEPNFYYVVTLMGWHYVQLGDFATAKTWFERSLRLNIINNRSAQNWLETVNRKLNEASSK